ncbi:MAG TPA: hypothetical protein VF157_12010, partial [Chloroflexota bacterium]
SGRIEDTQAFLQALYATDMDTIKGHIKLDADHDMVESIYIFQIAKSGADYSRQILTTYKGVGSFFDIGRDKGTRLPYGSLKGKWVGMTNDRLQQMYTTGQG